MKFNKKIAGIFLLPICAFVLLYCNGFLTQLIGNYQEWKMSSNIFEQNNFIAFPITDIGTCLAANWKFPYSMYAFGFIVCAIAVMCIYFFGFGRNSGLIDKDRNFEYSDKGTYGTAGYMTDAEMKSILQVVRNPLHTTGTILGEKDGKLLCVPQKTRMNRNIAVYGASGAMKSRAFARNMIFQCVKRGESLIITDPKSELFESMSEYLRSSGYVVKVFNLVNPMNSDSWNCLSEIEGEEILAQTFCDVIIRNTGSESSDHFWDNSEQNLLKALVLYVEHGYEESERNIGTVYQLLTLSSAADLNALFKNLPHNHPAKAPYNIFQQAGETVKGGIIIGLGSRLQVFQNALIREITSHNEIDLTLPGKSLCAYFCIVSDQDSTFNFLSSLFLTNVFIKLVRYADKHGEDGALPIPVHILADELANIGVIPDLTKKISTVRSRGISISVIFQSLAQMQNRYPFNQWQEILGNCDTQLFLGCTDEITAKYISDRTGEITIGVASESKSLKAFRLTNYSPDFKETRSIGRRKLLTPDEVLRLPLDESLIILRGQKVLRAQKYDYTKHPQSKFLVFKKAKEHVPMWRNENQCGNPKIMLDKSISITEEHKVLSPVFKKRPSVKYKDIKKFNSSPIEDSYRDIKKISEGKEGKDEEKSVKTVSIVSKDKIIEKTDEIVHSVLKESIEINLTESTNSASKGGDANTELEHLGLRKMTKKDIMSKK